MYSMCFSIAPLSVRPKRSWSQRSNTMWHATFCKIEQNKLVSLPSAALYTYQSCLDSRAAPADLHLALVWPSLRWQHSALQLLQLPQSLKSRSALKSGDSSALRACRRYPMTQSCFVWDCQAKITVRVMFLGPIKRCWLLVHMVAAPALGFYCGLAWSWPQTLERDVLSVTNQFANLSGLPAVEQGLWCSIATVSMLSRSPRTDYIALATFTCACNNRDGPSDSIMLDAARQEPRWYKGCCKTIHTNYAQRAEG